jgi:hypothetical protein
MEKKFKQDKGVAGLSIMLSLIVMLFVIGLIVMIFSIMGTRMRDATYTSTSGTKTNESLTGLAIAGDFLSVYTDRNAVCTASSMINRTDSVPILASGNYTINSGCNLTGTVGSPFLAYNVNVTYTYVYDNDNTATNVMNDTVNSVATTTDWFDIFIVIGAMVVLILLTVIIITAIRGSGMVAGAGSTNGANTVGTA